MPRVMHVEINAPDPDGLMAFYKNAFGWEIAKWEGPEDYWLLTTGEDGQPGINGAMMRSQDGQARTVNTIGVESVDEVVAKVTAAGGQVVMPKMAIPGIGWQAYCSDPQGTLLGLHQEDPEAK